MVASSPGCGRLSEHRPTPPGPRPQLRAAPTSVVTAAAFGLEAWGPEGQGLGSAGAPPLGTEDRSDPRVSRANTTATRVTTPTPAT